MFPSPFIGRVASPMSFFLWIEKLGQGFLGTDVFTLLASYCFLFFSITQLYFYISTVIQNVTHRASTKSPDKTPIGGTILREYLEICTEIKKVGLFFDNGSFTEFCTVSKSFELMLIHFLSVFNILVKNFEMLLLSC